jgi:hypothetical protein
MRAEERQAQLEKELAAERAQTARLEGELARERAENARLRQMMEEVLRRLGEVEGKWRGIATLAANPHRAMGWEASGLAYAREARKSQKGKRGILVTP